MHSQRNCNGYYEEGKIDSKWNTVQQADPVFGVYGTGCIAQFRDYAYIAQIWDTTVYARIQAKRNALSVGDVYENAKILAYAYYHTDDGFLYPGITLMDFPDAERNMEGNLKKQNKKFILYRDKADFDYNRKW